MYSKIPSDSINKGKAFSEEDKDRLEKADVIFLERIKGKH